MMNKTLNNLFVIASVGLAISAMIFLSINLFGESAPEWMLPAGMFCCVLSNLFNVIRSMQSKNHQ